jgi:hypothetical protein
VTRGEGRELMDSGVIPTILPSDSVVNAAPLW